MSCLPKWIFKIIYFRVLRVYPNMGERSSKSGYLGSVTIPPIGKLGDQDNYWTWRILIRSYLEALGLWAGNFPREGPQAKFILLSTVEIWILKREYEHFNCKQIYQDLEKRFSVPRPKSATTL
ncbi:uncharacterized protein [Drosophila pseudoobscura]|uniref:Uncharacterized protein n=1 Tax=Drosophila pseudoobscura pseudoobscura TaxID=46245 RepID=A0A6I8V776_DROPS|nr:uncharacterized protein LOC13036506 [Drosophila pseudoobscura]